MVTRVGLRKAGNGGLVVGTAAATGDVLHTMPTRAIAGLRSAIILKIMCYNNTGAGVTLQFGTLDRNPAGAAFVALLPIFFALNGLDNVWQEEEIAAIEWISSEALTAAGRTGDIRCVTGAAGVTLAIEIEEFGL